MDPLMIKIMFVVLGVAFALWLNSKWQAHREEQMKNEILSMMVTAFILEKYDEEFSEFMETKLSDSDE